MFKTKLKVAYDFDFCLIGVVCSEKDFRLCWMLNNHLGLKLAKTDDHVSGAGSHSFFVLNDEELMRDYYLIANKSDSGKLLVEEHQHTGYFIIIKGEITEDEKKYFAEQIKKLDSVSASYLIDADMLKSKHNLIF
jgi:hypothetical protein